MSHQKEKLALNDRLALIVTQYNSLWLVYWSFSTVKEKKSPAIVISFQDERCTESPGNNQFG